MMWQLTVHGRGSQSITHAGYHEHISNCAELRKRDSRVSLIIYVTGDAVVEIQQTKGCVTHKTYVMIPGSHHIAWFQLNSHSYIVERNSLKMIRGTGNEHVCALQDT
jgi:desulfoferrodoxin (superoxide reductase-like protein)